MKLADVKRNIFFMLVVFCSLDLILGTLCIRPIKGKLDPYYHHDLKKNFKGRLDWGAYYYDVFTDSLGFKDSSRRNVPVNNDKYRILFIGDSFTEGVGLAYDKTFTGIIDRDLGKENIEVLNAAVLSYSPKLYYLKLRYLLEEKKLHISELCVYIDISDIQDEVIYESFAPSKSRLRSGVIELKTFLRQRSLLYYVLSELKSKLSPDRLSASFDSGSRDGSERSAWTSDAGTFKKYGEKGIALAEKNMGLLHDLCKKYGIKMTIAVYPWPVQIEQKDLDCMQVRVWKRFCSDRGIAFINYFPDFINNEPAEKVIAGHFIKGDVHWNEAGHGVVAKKWLNIFKAGRYVKEQSGVNTRKR